MLCEIVLCEIVLCEIVCMLVWDYCDSVLVWYVWVLQAGLPWVVTEAATVINIGLTQYWLYTNVLEWDSL